MSRHKARNTAIVSLAVLGIGAMLMMPGGDNTAQTFSVNEAQPADRGRLANQLDQLVNPSFVGEVTAKETEVAAAPAAPKAAVAPTVEVAATTTTTAPATPAATTTPAAPQTPVQVAALTTPATVPGATTTEPAVASTGPRVRVAGSNVNLRVGPTTDSAKVQVISAGESVTLLDSSNGWALVQTSSGEEGWVSGQFLSRSDLKQVASVGEGNTPAVASLLSVVPEQPVKAKEPKENKKFSRLASSTMLYSSPKRGAPRIGIVSGGEPTRIIAREGRWALVETQSGASGWIRLASR